MSSQTPNINLTLPTGAENVSRQIINDNNTKIDTAIGTLNGNLTKSIKSVCPIAEGNTHSAFVAGNIIYIRNHPTLTEGSYTVTQYVAQNATLSDSNVTYNYYGGLDVLNDNINDYHTNSGTSTYASWDVRYSIVGRVCTFMFGFTPSSNISSSIGAISNTGLPNPASTDYVCIYPVTKVQQSYTVAETQNRFGGVKNIGSSNAEVRAVGAYESGVKYSFCGSYVIA